MKYLCKQDCHSIRPFVVFIRGGSDYLKIPAVGRMLKGEDEFNFISY